MAGGILLGGYVDRSKQFKAVTLKKKIRKNKQVAVMAGGILLGGYVDRSKQFKAVTLGCFAVTLSALGLLGMYMYYTSTNYFTNIIQVQIILQQILQYHTLQILYKYKYSKCISQGLQRVMTSTCRSGRW